MVLKDIQCPVDGCDGMVQATIDSDEEITKVSTMALIGGANIEVGECPECGANIGINTN